MLAFRDLFGNKEAAPHIGREMHLFRSAVEEADNLIVLADTTSENSIFYVNKSGREILGGLRDLGARSSLCAFDCEPSRMRTVLADLVSGKIQVHETRIPIGDRTFTARIHAVRENVDSDKVQCFLASFESESDQRHCA